MINTTDSQQNRLEPSQPPRAFTLTMTGVKKIQKDASAAVFLATSLLTLPAAADDHHSGHIHGAATYFPLEDRKFGGEIGLGLGFGSEENIHPEFSLHVGVARGKSPAQTPPEYHYMAPGHVSTYEYHIGPLASVVFPINKNFSFELGGGIGLGGTYQKRYETIAYGANGQNIPSEKVSETYPVMLFHCTLNLNLNDTYSIITGIGPHFAIPSGEAEKSSERGDEMSGHSHSDGNIKIDLPVFIGVGIEL